MAGTISSTWEQLVGFGGIEVWLVRAVPLRVAAGILSLGLILPLLAAIARPPAPSLNVADSCAFHTFFRSILTTYRWRNSALGWWFSSCHCVPSALFLRRSESNSRRQNAGSPQSLALLIPSLRRWLFLGIVALRQVSAVTAYIVPRYLGRSADASADSRAEDLTALLNRLASLRLSQRSSLYGVPSGPSRHDRT